MDPVVEELEIEAGEQVRREVEIDAGPEEAWEAISDPAVLERWLADQVDLEPVEGSPATFTVDGEERPGTVERVVAGRELAFTWEREPGDASVVRFELIPCVSGTRVRVTETRLRAGARLAMSGGWPQAFARLAWISASVPV